MRKSHISLFLMSTTLFEEQIKHTMNEISYTDRLLTWRTDFWHCTLNGYKLQLIKKIKKIEVRKIRVGTWPHSRGQRKSLSDSFFCTTEINKIVRNFWILFTVEKTCISIKDRMKIAISVKELQRNRNFGNGAWNKCGIHQRIAK